MPAVSSIYIGNPLKTPALVANRTQSSLVKNPLRSLLESTRASVESSRVAICSLDISKEKTATSRSLCRATCVGDIHRKGRFSHTRTGCNQNQVRPIQAGHNRIQVLKSGASTNIFFFVRACNLSNVVISTTNCIPDFYHALCIFPLPNLKNTLLRCIQQHLCTLFPCLDVL